MDINNDITVIGSVSEYPISIKECVRKLKDGTSVNAWWIGGKLDTLYKKEAEEKDKNKKEIEEAKWKIT